MMTPNHIELIDGEFIAAAILYTLFILFCGWKMRGPRKVFIVRPVETPSSEAMNVANQMRTIARLKQMHQYDVEQIVVLQEQVERFQAKEGLPMHRAGESPASTRNGAPRA